MTKQHKWTEKLELKLRARPPKPAPILGWDVRWDTRDDEAKDRAIEALRYLLKRVRRDELEIDLQHFAYDVRAKSKKERDAQIAEENARYTTEAPEAPEAAYTRGSSTGGPFAELGGKRFAGEELKSIDVCIETGETSKILMDAIAAGKYPSFKVKSARAEKVAAPATTMKEGLEGEPSRIYKETVQYETPTPGFFQDAIVEAQARNLREGIATREKALKMAADLVSEPAPARAQETAGVKFSMNKSEEGKRGIWKIAQIEASYEGGPIVQDSFQALADLTGEQIRDAYGPTRLAILIEKARERKITDDAAKAEATKDCIPECLASGFHEIGCPKWQGPGVAELERWRRIEAGQEEANVSACPWCHKPRGEAHSTACPFPLYLKLHDFAWSKVCDTCGAMEGAHFAGCPELAPKHEAGEQSPAADRLKLEPDLSDPDVYRADDPEVCIFNLRCGICEAVREVDSLAYSWKADIIAFYGAHGRNCKAPALEPETFIQLNRDTTIAEDLVDVAALDAGDDDGMLSIKDRAPEPATAAAPCSCIEKPRPGEAHKMKCRHYGKLERCACDWLTDTERIVPSSFHEKACPLYELVEVAAVDTTKGKPSLELPAPKLKTDKPTAEELTEIATCKVCGAGPGAKCDTKMHDVAAAESKTAPKPENFPVRRPDKPTRKRLY